VFTPPLQTIVNGLADRLGLPVVLEDVDQQLLAYSAHYDVTDRIREETILRRTTAQGVVEIFRRYDLTTRTDPFVIAGDPSIGMLPRLVIPVRYLDVLLGYAWVLLPSGEADEAVLATAAEVTEQLSLAMLAESRVRVRESDSLLSLISPDPDSRVQGLIDVESRGGFEAPRHLAVVVCGGPAWQDAGVRGAFWTAGWTPDPSSRLRGATSREGVVLASLAGDARDELAGHLERALAHVGRQRGEDALVLGIGGVVHQPDDAHESYRQARLAARVALRDTGVGRIAWWEALGQYRFLAQLPLRTLADAVDPRVGRLAARHASLLETAECYLDHTGAIGAVADALHIHRTTLYYRLDRLRELGVDPAAAADRAALTSSLAALRLLGRWPVRR
jgi:hypothetical protein